MKRDLQVSWIDRIGLAAIVFVILGYVLFGASFAQLRLEFSFLNFPIFIGEILLLFTSLLFVVKKAWQKWDLGPWGWVLGAYLIFMLIKAFSGYFSWGPLAFRDAALFYYPLFIVLGYSFWSNDLWGDNTRRLLIFIILSILILYQFIPFWPCTLIIMGILLAIQAKSFQERIALIGILLFFTPYKVLFNVCYRTVLLSSLITLIFIGIIFFLLWCRPRWMRNVGMILGGLVLIIVLFKACQSDTGKTFVVKDTKPLAAVMPQEPDRGKYLFHPVGKSPVKTNAIKDFVHKVIKGSVIKDNKSAFKKENDVRIKKDDTRFRYYIWRDMAHEYAHYKPLFGFDFGRPFISSTMKYYGLASTEDTDGWIGAHNSLLYIIYRAGIVGLAMVLSLFIIWFGLLCDFYILKDWTGILLCAILLNWIVSANFFLIFELPYTAIPVWTILGITLKHRILLKKTTLENKSCPLPSFSDI